MPAPPLTSALIVGAGAGLSAALARRCAAAGMAVHLAARSPDRLAGLGRETGATLHRCDATDPAAVDALFGAVDDALGGPPGGAPDVVVYNPSFRTRGAIADLDRDLVQKTLQVTAFGAFLVGQAAARRMLPRGSGVIAFTGASAGRKGYPRSAPFAMGKFALRGLCQSMARELHPKGIHIAHVVIDGGIRADRQPDDPAVPDSRLDPDAIAGSYLDIARQDRSAWAWEIELRPWVETF